MLFIRDETVNFLNEVAGNATDAGEPFQKFFVQEFAKSAFNIKKGSNKTVSRVNQDLGMKRLKVKKVEGFYELAKQENHMDSYSLKKNS